jgi:hypothetical protein
MQVQVTEYSGFEAVIAISVKSCITWDIMLYTPMEVNDVSQAHFASIFRTYEQDEQQNSMNQAAS